MRMYNYVVYNTPEYQAACKENPRIKVCCSADEDFVFRTPINSFDELLNDRYDDIVKMEFSQRLNYIESSEEGSETQYDIVSTNNGYHLIIESQPDLSRMTRFPARIQQFRCTSCLIQKLPPIPKTMIKLDVSGNHIGELPPLKDTNLCVLYCSECNLDTLPQLPETLIRLNCSHNNIKSISEPLPEILGEIAIYNNKITQLPFPSKMTWTMNYNNNPIKDHNDYMEYINGITMEKRKENYKICVNSGFNHMAFDEFNHYITVLHKIN